MGVPLFVTRPALAPLLAEIAERQRAVLDSGSYILGPEVASFERELAAYVGVRHCVGLASGTDALTIGLRALGIGPGDEVVVPALTFYATAEAVLIAGATPVFCDIDPRTYTITAETLGDSIGERTRAIVPVHLYGNPAPVAELRAAVEGRGIRILEDAAQAMGASLRGARAGSLGDAAAASFHPAKNLGGFGDGGALLTDDDEVAVLARRLRAHGSDDRVTHTEVGFNSRLDELQAAALRVLLPHLDGWTEARRAAAAAYAAAGLGELVQPPQETDGAEHCYHLYVVRTPDRDRLIRDLAERSVEARAYYTIPLHRQPALSRYAPAAELPEADGASRESMAIPMGPALGRAQVERVHEALSGAMAADSMRR